MDFYRRLKVVVLAVLIVGATSGLCGCVSEGPTKKELMIDNDRMMQMLQDYEVKVEEMEKSMAALSTDGKYKGAIITIGTGTNKPTFNSLGGKIIFEKAFEYKGTSQAPNTASLNIAQNVVIVPSNNWLIKMDGTRVEFNHPSGIVGEIQVGNIKETVQNDEIEETIFEPFLVGVPNEGTTYGDLFLENTRWGKHCNVLTAVDEEPGVLKLGALGVGNTSVIYMFYYGGERDATKDELVDIMVRTMKVNGQSLRFN